jgi:hypothetical protein
LYDYKEDNMIHIGGNDVLKTNELCDLLKQKMALVTPKKYKASYHYFSNGIYQ